MTAVDVKLSVKAALERALASATTANEVQATLEQTRYRFYVYEQDMQSRIETRAPVLEAYDRLLEKIGDECHSLDYKLFHQHRDSYIHTRPGQEYTPLVLETDAAALDSLRETDTKQLRKRFGVFADWAGQNNHAAQQRFERDAALIHICPETEAGARADFTESETLRMDITQCLRKERLLDPKYRSRDSKYAVQALHDALGKIENVTMYLIQLMYTIDGHHDTESERESESEDEEYHSDHWEEGAAGTATGAAGRGTATCFRAGSR